MQTIFESWDAIPLTENHIKQLHGILLRHSTKDARHRGEYKTLPNHVEAFDEHGTSLGIVFATALTEARLHPLLIIAMFTVTFLAIHPFQDSNGRRSRVLTTLLLLRAGYAYVP